MVMALDLRVAELLCSRLCHDLVSPVGAVANGMELVAELGGAMDDEIAGMIGDSAALASARLRFFRAAYGLAGGQDTNSTEELKNLAESRAAGEGYHLDWAAEPGRIAGRGKSGKLALNLQLLAEEALMRGGTISLRSDAGLEAIAEGAGAALRAEQIAALRPDTPVAELTARTVHAFYTARLASECGLALSVETAGEGRVVFHAK
ncbi:MAG: histidine phosphotransferase family protein [Proteobacteria bacterium]|nr:histidine phosphotransferase family protein [Pseudomonadota bacterium]